MPWFQTSRVQEMQSCLEVLNANRCVCEETQTHQNLQSSKPYRSTPPAIYFQRQTPTNCPTKRCGKPPSTQSAIQSLKGKFTMIIIAHRLSTIKDASSIIVIDSGSICEFGTHDQLLQNQGMYYELLQKQSMVK